MGISHQREFYSALCPEVWSVVDGKCSVSGSEWMDAAEKARKKAEKEASKTASLSKEASSTRSATRSRTRAPRRRSPSRSSRRSRSASPTFARRVRRSGPTRRSRRRATSSPSKLTYIPQQQLLVSYHRVVRSHNQAYVSVQPSHAAQICSSKQTYHYRSQQYELEGPSSFARENWISWCCESVCRRRLGQRPCGYRFGIAPRVLNLRISLACCGESLMCGR